MQRFKALLASKSDTGSSLGWQDLDQGESDGRRRHRPRQPFDGQLQGRPRDHRQVAGRAPLADDPRHRLRRHRRVLDQPRLQGRRRGRSSTAGAWARRITAATPSWRASRATGWCRCPRGFTPAEAMAIGTAGYTAMLCVLALERHGVTPAQRAGARDRRRRRRRLRRHRAAGEARLSGHRLDRPDGGGRLPQGPRRRGDHRPRPSSPDPPRRSAKERWAGGRRRGRQPHARQRAVA